MYLEEVVQTRLPVQSLECTCAVTWKVYIGVIWGIMEKKIETIIMGYIGIIGYMGGCQNYGLFLDPHYNTAPNI